MGLCGKALVTAGLLWAEPSTVLYQTRASSNCPKRNSLLPGLSHGQCWMCSGRANWRKGKKVLCNRSWKKGVRNVRGAALQAPRSVQKEGKRCSRYETEAPCSPGEADGGAGCPPAAHGQCAEQSSACSMCHSLLRVHTLSKRFWFKTCFSFFFPPKIFYI